MSDPLSGPIRDLGQAFEAVADAYDAARPTYPDEMYRALSEISGIELVGARVLDVGAGTGIVTRALRARGSEVIAIDPGAEMLTRLHARAGLDDGLRARADLDDGLHARAGLDDGLDVSTAAAARIGAVLADGNVLPLLDQTVDLITYGQSWHWLDSVRSVAEARRVLRPGGAMAGCWNFADSRQADWLAAYERRLAQEVPRYWGPALEEWSVPPMASFVDVVEERWVPWTRMITVDDFLLDLRSHSYMAALSPETADELAGARREELAEVFPEGLMAVPMRTYLVVGR